MGLETARENMLQKQIRDGFVTDEKTIHAMREVPRELFVPEMYRAFAFADMQIAIGHGQMMMTPNEEAQIIQALQIQATDSVLEIGTGTGYLTAVLAALARRVETIDYFGSFINAAQQRLHHLGVDNVELMQQDANSDFLKSSYDIIVMTASVSMVPKIFLQHLNLGGRLFVITGKAPSMQAVRYTHVNKGAWIDQLLFNTLVPELIHASKPEVFVF